MKKTVGFLAILLVAVTVAAVSFYQSKVNHRLSIGMRINISEGEGFYAAIAKVKRGDPGVSKKAAKLYLKLNGLGKSLKAGEYSFSKGSSLKKIIKDFSIGNVLKYKIVIPEGYNLFEIASLLLEKGIIKSKKDFLSLTRSKSIAFEHLGYESQSLEGYLYPATYEFSKNMKAALIVKILVDTHKNNFDLLMSEVSLPKSFTHHDLVTLASVVEKETGASHERPIIASVFWNRLRKKMRLQSDPTTIYGQWVKTGKRLFNIRKKHLLEKNDYNTYSIRALPIGPISNPGYEALKAVCNPSKTDFLYFVSKNDGTHYFSKTYKEHLAAVRRFQLSRKARAGKSWRNLKQK